MKKKDNRGGKRQGAGRPKVESPLITLTVRVDAAALSTCRERYGKTLNQKVNSFIKRLARKK